VCLLTRDTSMGQVQVLKPAVPREVKFYEDELPKLEALRPYLPVYHGTVEAPKDAPPEMLKDIHDTRYIAMDNLTHGYSKPCVLDLKMGTRQHGHDAAPKKVATMTAKCKATTSGCMGFRLCGMKVYNMTTGNYAYRDKYFGRRIKPHEVWEAVEMFFHNGDRVRVEMIPLMLEEVFGLLEVLQICDRHRFFSTSLLLIYEGDATKEHRVTVKLIDFARTMSLEENSSRSSRANNGTSGLEENSSRDPAGGHTPGGCEAAALPEAPSINQGNKREPEARAAMPVDTLPSGHTGGQEEGTVAMPRDEREDWIGPDQGLIRGLRSIAEVMEVAMFNCQAREARSAGLLKSSSLDLGVGLEDAET